MKHLNYLLLFLASTVTAAEPELSCSDSSELNPGQRFSQEIITSDLGDYKVVNDKATGLQWTFCLAGQSLSSDEASCDGEPTFPASAESAANNGFNLRQVAMSVLIQENQRVNTDGDDWRLPSTKELLSIYNQNCTPALYPVFSYSSNLTETEIEDLTTACTGCSENDELYYDRERGKAYQRYSLLSDTTRTDTKTVQTYHVVHFSSSDSPIGTSGTFSVTKPMGAPMRLVREIPQ